MLAAGIDDVLITTEIVGVGKAERSRDSSGTIPASAWSPSSTASPVRDR
jgi:hypothetical protein